MHPMIAAMLRRRSVRSYTERPIEDRLLEEVLLAGACAPSAHNSQPWRIVAVKTPESKAALIEAMGARFRADMEKARFSREKISQRLARSRDIFFQAAVLVVLFANRNTADNPLAADGIEQLLTAQSVALAAGQILMAASHVGLGGCWFAAPLFCPKEVCAACGITADWAPQCLLTLGYPAEVPAAKEPCTNNILYL